MGRQAYLNRLALGRSPYEPPEVSSVDPSGPVRRVSSIHADSYMQQYDSRGHPTNPQSKTLGRELRRAKNDILSTMGIVVSREDRNVNPADEQETITQIAAENDFGLVMTTLDQLLVFFGTWWSSSFTGRVYTYKRYTHAAILEAMQSERHAVGIISFYTAGVPAWAMSSTLALARGNPLKRVFVTIRDYFLGFTSNESLYPAIRSLSGLAYWVTRNCVLLLSVEAYMYSLLQGLSLVPANALPSVRLLIPFGESSLVQLPPLPTDLSASSIGIFLLRLMTSPGVLTFIHAFYLRPELEERIYRLIRRQLPKPSLADELSIRVAYEENLIEWLVPTLGRKSEEETRRARLTLFEDIKHEIAALGASVFSVFGVLSNRTPDPQTIEGVDPERIESLRNTIESLRHELEEAQIRADTADSSESDAPNPAIPATLQDVSATAEDAQAGDPEASLDMNPVFTNENRMSQSPGEMSNDYFSDMATLGRTTAHSAASHPPSRPSHLQQSESVDMDQQNSRSNTLGSRPSSPETSPPTSPRVRASLIHQNSDIITMQLELLSNRNRNRNPQPPTSVPGPQFSRVGSDSPGLHSHLANLNRNQSIAEFLEALILTQAHLQATRQSSQTDDDLSSSRGEGQSADSLEPEVRDLLQVGVIPSQVPFPATSQLPNNLPDGAEESTDEAITRPVPAIGAVQNSDSLTRTEALPPPDPTHVPGQPLTDPSAVAHRVTLLSAHPVDSLASHLAAVISTVILSPLESLTLRSLATFHLIVHPSSSITLSDLHPIGLWFGGRTWSDAFAYTGRLVLLRGMQTALRAGVWGFLVGSTMRIGRKFCGWGDL